jgi:hypothetical protein
MNNSSAVRFKIPRDVWIGLVTLVFSVLYWRAADGIPISPLDGVVNAGALPKALAYAMMFFSLLLILRALLTERMYLRAARRAARSSRRPPGRGRGQEFFGPPACESFRRPRDRGGLPSGASVAGLFRQCHAADHSHVDLHRCQGQRLHIGGGSGCVDVIFYLLFVQLLDIPLAPLASGRSCLVDQSDCQEPAQGWL